MDWKSVLMDDIERDKQRMIAAVESGNVLELPISGEEPHPRAVELANKLFGINQIDQYFRYAQSLYFNKKYNNGVASFVACLIECESDPHLCACLGPVNNYPVCPCRMYEEMVKHKIDILDYVISNHIDVNSGFDEYVKKQKEREATLTAFLTLIKRVER